MMAKLFRKRAAKVWTILHEKIGTSTLEILPPGTRDFYHAVVRKLLGKNIPFLVGGAYAFSHYTGIVRHTKDLDLFCRPADCERLLDAMATEGYRTEVTFRHWIGKIWSDQNDLVDIIYGSGNGICEVDEDWFGQAPTGDFLGLPVRVVPCEEMIWSKGYILERNRYDGADVAHLLRAQGMKMDWNRLLARFGAHWRVLYAHLVLFGFIYPDEPRQIPQDVIQDLTERLRRESAFPPAVERPPLCQGTLFSHSQYRKDIADWGYRDARLAPQGEMSAEDIRQWTAAFADDKP